MHDPRESHLAALKRLLRYARGTVDLSTSAWCFAARPLLSLLSTPMLTGLAVRTLDAPLPAMPFFWAAILSPGRPSCSRLYPASVPRRSTVLSLTAWRRRPDFDSFGGVP